MIRTAIETFVNSKNSDTLESRIRNLSTENSLMLFVVFVVVLMVNLLVVRYVWNNVLPRALPGVKPIDLWTALGLKVLVLSLL